MKESDKPIIEFIEPTADLFLYQDVVVLKPKGIGGFLTKGLQGEKRIPLKSISAVQIKEAGFTTGYIQFTIAGGNESTAGALDAVYDENSFVFGGFMDSANDDKNKKAQDIRDKIEAYREARSLGSQETSLADQIRSLKELLDAGALTDTEFASAKAKLLS